MREGKFEFGQRHVRGGGAEPGVVRALIAQGFLRPFQFGARRAHGGFGFAEAGQCVVQILRRHQLALCECLQAINGASGVVRRDLSFAQCGAGGPDPRAVGTGVLGGEVQPRTGALQPGFEGCRAEIKQRLTGAHELVVDDVNCFRRRRDAG